MANPFPNPTATPSPMVHQDLVTLIRQALSAGDLTRAASLYELRAGVAAPALLEQMTTMTPAEQTALASLLASVRDYGYAAAAYDRLGQPAHAATMYQQAGEYVLAARCHQAAGNTLAAAAAMERAGKPQAALDLYLSGNATDAAGQLLVRQGAFLEAAALYRNTGNLRAEVDMLYRVELFSPHRPAAALRLAQLLDQFGHADQAVQVLWETVAQNRGAATDPACINALLTLCQRHGLTDLVAQVNARMQEVAGGPAPARPSDSAEMRRLMEHHNIRAQQEVEQHDQRPKAPELITAQPTVVDPFSSVLQRGNSAEADAYAFLKQLPIFQELAFPDLQAIYRVGQMVEYPSGTVIIEQDVRGSGLMVLLGGQVQVWHMGGGDGGSGALLATLGPGEALGEVSVLDGSATSARVVAAGAVQALVLPRDALMDCLATRDAAALRIYRALIRTLGGRLRAVNARV